MSITKVTTNFRITITSDIRKLANIKEGDKLRFAMVNNEIKIEKVDKKF